MDNYLERPVVLTQEQLENVLTYLGAWRTKNQGNNVQSSHCLIHGNDSPTLGVSLDAPHSWNCFSCHAKGPDIVSLVQRVKRCKTRQDAYMLLVEKFNLDMTPPKFSLSPRLHLQKEQREVFKLSRVALAAYPLDVEGDPIGYRAVQYYMGLDKEWADRLHLGYRRKDHRLIFPVFHPDNSLGGLIGRSMMPKCPHSARWMNFDAEHFKRDSVLMGSELPLVAGQSLIIVEGPKDYCKVRSFGHQNVRCILGSAPSEQQYERIIGYGLPVIPLLDDDRAGKAGRAVMLKCLKGSVRLLDFEYPESCRDASGKADPGALTQASFAELMSSVRAGFNFARLSKKRSTPA